MAQISMYDVPSARLETYEDIDELLASMQEREADAEYYSHKDISSCRTYFFYDKLICGLSGPRIY